MIQTKRFLFRLFFGIEVTVFILMYIFGSQGLHVILSMRKENGILAVEIRELTCQVETLKKTLVAWKNNSFYKEKIAREHLHMARPQDEVYFID